MRPVSAVIMAAVWNYFKIKEEKKQSRVQFMQRFVATKRKRFERRQKRFKTTNLIKHLQKHHGKEYA